MGDPIQLAKVLPGTPAPVPLKPIDPNESDQGAPDAGKATRKPIKITAPFMPKAIDRVGKTAIGPPITKLIPAVIKEIPAVLIDVQDAAGNRYQFEKSPAQTQIIEPERTEIIAPGASGLLNGPGGVRHRAKINNYTHVYQKPIVNVALQIAMDKRKAAQNA